MEWLGKLLFPKNPRWVRYRKRQLLLFTVTLSLLACLLVGVLFYLLNQVPKY